MSIGKHGRELSVAGAYLAVLAVLALLTPSFFHSQYYATWLTAAPILVAGIGMTMVILARHIDVSIGWQMSICVIGALAAKSGLSMPMAVLLAMLSGAAMGAVNGTLVAMLGFPSIVVTLATRLIFQQSFEMGTRRASRRWTSARFSVVRCFTGTRAMDCALYYDCCICNCGVVDAMAGRGSNDLCGRIGCGGSAARGRSSEASGVWRFCFDGRDGRISGDFG